MKTKIKVLVVAASFHILNSTCCIAQTVGIGSASFTPQSTLDVKGNMTIGSTYGGTNAAPANGLIVEGNVGIGSTNPGCLLDVNGTLRVNNKIISSSSQDILVNPGNQSGGGTGKCLRIGTGVRPSLVGYELVQLDDEDGGRSDMSFVVANHGYAEMHFATSGGSLTTPSISGNNDPIYLINFDGYTGSHYSVAAQIGASLEGGLTSSNMPGAIFFSTSPGAIHTDDGVPIATERMRINSAGNVGIGTTGPANKLDVAGSEIIGSGYVGFAAPTDGLAVAGNVAFGSIIPKSNLHITTGGVTSGLGSTPAGRGIALTGNGGTDRIYFEAPDAPTDKRVFMLDNNAGIFSVGSLNNDASGFVTQNILNLIPNGNVGIGCTDPKYTLHVIGDIASSATVRSTNALVTGAITACSDLRYKTNIEPLTSSLNNVLKLQGVSYNWKVKEFESKNFSEKTQIGFIAQEMEKIYPQVVLTDVDGYKAIDYAKLTPVLVEAIKEQQKMIVEQQKANADQQKTIESLQLIVLELQKVFEATMIMAKANN